MSSNLWNCSYSLLPIRPPQFCYDEAKIGKILNFYSASRQGGGQSRRPSKGQIPVCAASGANTLQGGVVGGSNCRGNILQPSPPDRTCQCTVHMVEGRSYRARGISKHVPTICNARDRDPRAPNTLAFCVIFFAPLAAPASYTLPRGMGKHRAGVGGFKEN